MNAVSSNAAPVPLACDPAPVQSSVIVLLIDDQTTVHETVQCLLDAEPDIVYHYCNTADQALKMAVAVQPTVILQDLIMPTTDGMALVKQFRNQAETLDVPIIMLSTNDDPQTKAEAFAIGVNDYLVKLPDRIEFIARIRYHSQAYLNRHAQAAALVAQAQAKELQQTLQELRDTQAQLIQTEKLSSLGQMLAGIAHEINNPINFIFGNLTYIEDYINDLLKLISLYQEYYPDPELAVRSHLDEIDYDFITDDLVKMLRSTRMGAERIIQIALSLRNSSRQDHNVMGLSNIHDGIESTLLILEHRLKLGIEVVRQYGELPLVECYAAQLNQVFMNILNNAIDALEETYTPGRLTELDQELTIEDLGPLSSHKPTIYIRTEAIAPNRIAIRIADNGAGMSADVQAKLFDAFFTTKPVGKGTGLGLSICQKIISKHQGTLRVYSEVGKGTDFVIELAVQPEAQ